MKKKITIGISLIIVVFTIVSLINSKGKNPTNISVYTVPEVPVIVAEGIITSDKYEYNNDATKGEVYEIYVKNKDHVNKGDVIFKYKNKSVTDEIEILKNQISSTEESIKETQSTLNDNINKKNEFLSQIQSPLEDLNYEPVEHDYTNISLSDNSIKIESIKSQLNLIEESIKSQETSIKQYNKAIGSTQKQINKKQVEEYSSIHAKFDGIVTSISTDLKDLSKPVLTLIDEKIYISSQVSEIDINKLQEGNKTEIIIYSSNETLIGEISKVERIEPLDHLATSTNRASISENNISYYKVNIESPNLKENQRGFHAQLKVKEKYDITIPKSLILNDKGTKYVWLIKDKKLFKKVVTIENVNDKLDKILTGIIIGDKILSKPTGAEKEGDIVE